MTLLFLKVFWTHSENLFDTLKIKCWQNEQGYFFFLYSSGAHLPLSENTFLCFISINCLTSNPPILCIQFQLFPHHKYKNIPPPPKPCAMSKGVSHWPLTMEAWFNPSKLHVGQSCTLTGFSLSASVSP